MEKYIVNSYLKDGTIQVDTKIGDHKLISDERMAEGGHQPLFINNINNDHQRD
mgnify:CR=1 FL=1